LVTAFRGWSVGPDCSWVEVFYCQEIYDVECYFMMSVATDARSNNSLKLENVNNLFYHLL
jgi:hypothetical protein